jgi:hypothetical protein
MSPPLIPIEQKLKNYSVSDKGCWIFLGAKDRDGYGVFGHTKGKQLRAHRASYEFYKGKVSKDLLVCHICDITSCINPSHLFLGSPKDNTHDMIKKGRKASHKGQNHPSAKINDLDVIWIRKQRDSGRKLKDIASDIGVSFGHISAICKRIVWKHI